MNKLSPKEIDILKQKSTSASAILKELEDDDDYDMMNFDYSNNPTESEDRIIMTKVIDAVEDLDPVEETLRAMESQVAALPVQQEEEPKEEPKTPDELRKEAAIRALEALPSAPTAELIAKWKKNYGDDSVHLIALGRKDVYVFTSLTKGRWDKIREFTAKQQQAQPDKDPADLLKEKVVLASVLWPKLDVSFLVNSKAGTIDTIFESIMMTSYFLNQPQIAALTHEL